jgi:hypothetical protein
MSNDTLLSTKSAILGIFIGGAPARTLYRELRLHPARDQHHARPAPRAELHAGRFLRDEKASSGLPLQPTDLPSLLTEQIAHFSPLLRDDAIPDGFVFLAGTMEPSPALPICFVAKGGLPQKPC